MDTDNMEKLSKLATLICSYILTMTTEAGSGHPTSSLSATELMACFVFGGIFRFDVDRPQYPNNGRLIFSKGHGIPDRFMKIKKPPLPEKAAIGA